MAKTWVLDTETKGTGAHIAPLEPAAPSPRDRQLSLVELRRPPRAGETTEHLDSPLRLKVVSLLSGEPLGEDVDAREAVRLLEGLRSIVDASIYVWLPETRRWRMLTLQETRALWSFRGSVG